jgi:hypothetical protein
MKTFLSYSRKDESVVKTLAQGLEAAKRDVWFDHDLRGGDVWWDSILDNIRNSAVYLFALSDASLQSKPCRLELDYALALGLPILPVQVGPVGALRTNPLAELQIIDYSPDDAQSGFRVLAAVDDAAGRLRPLPDPLPTPPPIPFAYLLALGRQIDSTELSVDEQRAVVDQLRRALGDETDESVRQDILTMLGNLNRKPWTTRWAEKEIRALLMVHGPGSTAPPDAGPTEPRSDEAGTTQGGAGPGRADPIRAGQPPAPDPREWFAERLERLHRERTELERRIDPDPAPWRPSPAVASQWRQAYETGGPGGGAASAGQRPPTPAGFEARPATPPSPQPTVRPEGGLAGPPQSGQGHWAAQPQPQPQPPPPPNYWALSIVSFLLSLLIGGIAMYFSYSVGRRYQAGDLDGARRASRNAKVWGIVGIVLGAIVIFAAI